MHFAHLVAFASIEKHTLSGRGFTRVHMSHDTDVTVTVNRCNTSHKALANLEAQ
jgi:hypothetical protein